MVKLHSLSKLVARRKKRLGRGYGSGKGGHTSSRGQKGQKSRSKVGLMFEGTKMRKSLLQRMPMLRGKGKLISYKKKPIIIDLGKLDIFDNQSVITTKLLVKKGLVGKKQAKSRPIKILGNGKLTKKLVVKLPISKQARKQIEELGGSVETNQ